jgi:hypothetical protein
VVGYAALFGVGLLRTIYGLAPVELLDASTLGYLLPAAPRMLEQPPAEPEPKIAPGGWR